MLSSHQPFRKLNILKKHKVEPMPNVSLDNLASLVKRLSVQVDDLVEDQKKANSPVEPIIQHFQEQPLPPLPAPEVQANTPIKTIHTRQNSISQYITAPERTAHPGSHTTIDPWSSYVPQNYGALLQRLEDIESLQKCPNECCSSTGTVSTADGVPWPQPIEPFRPVSPMDSNEMLDVQYTHWCTLMRCLPLMDPVTSAHVKTVGLYAMREILKSKASQKRDHDLPTINTKNLSCCNLSSTQHPLETTTKLRESMSCLSAVGGLATTAPTAVHDMPVWMSTSETKTALDGEAGPAPPAKESQERESTITPTPSGFNSPLFTHSGKRFTKWVQYKKLQKKSNTDTANTPLGQSQTLRKIGSWFF